MLDLSKHCPMCGGPLALYAERIEDGAHNGLPDPLLLCTCEVLTLQDIIYHSYTEFRTDKE